MARAFILLLIYNMTEKITNAHMLICTAASANEANHSEVIFAVK